jgi:hypothetical protein
MITPTDYLAVLGNYEDNNGTVSFWFARTCAKLMGIMDGFSATYGCMIGQRVDLGEFRVWALDELYSRV